MKTLAERKRYGLGKRLYKSLLELGLTDEDIAVWRADNPDAARPFLVRGRQFKQGERSIRYIDGRNRSRLLLSEEYNRLLVAQDFKCAICACELSLDASGARPAIDHDHGTNEVRGILCHRCNIGLGYYESWTSEDLERLDRYLASAAHITATRLGSKGPLLCVKHR